MNHLDKSKLIRLLKLLSNKEFEEFEKWLNSPWCQKNKYFLPFFKIIRLAAPKFASVSLNKTLIFSLLYPAKNYDNRIFNNLILALAKEVERYLAHLQLQKDKLLQQQLLGKAFTAKKQIDLFEETNQKIIKDLETKANKSTTDYLLLSQLNHALYFQTSGHHRYQPETPTLEKTITYLNHFYLLESYGYLHEIHARAKILKLTEQLTSPNNHLLLTKLQAQLKLVPAHLYEFRLRTHLAATWSDYLAFKALYLNAFVQLHFSFQQSFLFYCINDVVDFSAKGQPEAIAELYEWYQLGLDHQLLMQDGMITGGTYNNVILTACHLEKHDFLLQFIETYTPKLPKTIRLQAKSWANAQVDYALGKYEVTIDALKDWIPDNKLYAIQTKITLLKANFKLILADSSHVERFQSYCLAFEKYIKRNQLYSVNRSTSFLKYIQYARKIALLCYKTPDTSKWKQLIKSIEEEKILFGKSWLLTEIELIRKGQNK